MFIQRKMWCRSNSQAFRVHIGRINRSKRLPTHSGHIRAQVGSRYVLPVINELNILHVVGPVAPPRARCVDEIPQRLTNIYVHPLRVVALQMQRGCIAELDAPEPTQLLQEHIVKLRTVVREHCARWPPFQKDPPQKYCIDGFSSLVGNGSQPEPMREWIHDNKNVNGLLRTFSSFVDRHKRPHQVHTDHCHERVKGVARQVALSTWLRSLCELTRNALRDVLPNVHFHFVSEILVGSVLVGTFSSFMASPHTTVHVAKYRGPQQLRHERTR